MKHLLRSLFLLLVLAVPALATLPSSLTLSSGGSSGVNGNYNPYSGSTSSCTQYTNGTYYIEFVSGPGGSAWEVGTTPNASYMNAFAYTNTGGSTTTFPLTGWTVNGGVAPSPTFTAYAPTPPSGTFTASPQTVAPGASSTLTWSIQGATSVTLATGGASPVSVAASASQSVSPSATTTYEIAATNAAGTVYSDQTVQVTAPTVQSVTTSPTSITGSASSSQNVTLTVNLSSAALSGGAAINITNTTAGGFTGSVGYTTQLMIPQGQTSASETVGIGASSSSGSVTLTGQYGSSSQSATVTVSAPGPTLPATLYVYGAGTASYNGTYTNAGGTEYAGPNGSHLGYDGGNAVWDLYIPSTSTFGYSFSSTSSAPTGSYHPVGAGVAPNATVSATNPAPPSSGGGGSSVGATGSPGVSISASPYTVGPGGASVLRWDTSGATTVTVTGVSNPSATGTLNITPAASTTYTVTATNSYGTNSQSVTVTVDSTLPSGTTGASSFTAGSPVSSSGASYAAPTLPGFSLPAMTIAGFGGIPPLTIPGLTLPPITLPALNIPGINAPGDLKIGIPGIGSIGIPTGWLTQLIAAAINPASIAQQMSTYTVGQFNALATFNAGQAVATAVNNGTYTLQQINSTTSAQNLAAHNETMATMNATATATQNIINTTATATQTNENNNFTSMLTAGPGGLLTKLFQYLFIPDQATLNTFSQTSAAFLNWGPYQFIASTQALFAPAQGTQVTGAPILPFARQAPSLETGVHADLSRPRALYSRSYPAGSTPNVLGSAAPTPVYGVPLPDPGTDLAIPLMEPVQSQSVSVGLGGVTTTPSVVWTNTGQKVAFDFTPMTNAKFWPFFRLLEGAAVYLVFGMGVMKRLFPKQVL